VNVYFVFEGEGDWVFFQSVLILTGQLFMNSVNIQSFNVTENTKYAKINDCNESEIGTALQNQGSNV